MKKNSSAAKAKDAPSVSPVDFKKQTSEPAIGYEKPDPLYERAFLSHEDQNASEYTRNTTTWD